MKKLVVVMIFIFNVLLSCTITFAEQSYNQEMTAYVHSNWMIDMPNVLYQADNHDICELAQKEDGQFYLKLLEPGDTVVTAYIIENKKLYLLGRFLLHVLPQNSEEYAINSADSTGFPNVIPTGYYNGNIGATYNGNLDGIVPLNQLANYKLLHWNLTDEQLKECYEAVKPFVVSIKTLSYEEQMNKIALELRDFFDARGEYSDKAPHFLDAYGYLILKKASCQGATAATGLCLNMLGIDYEHVNHNKWTHQWCRVKNDNTYWIVDPFGLYCGPEPGEYKHPIDSQQ